VYVALIYSRESGDKNVTLGNTTPHFVGKKTNTAKKINNGFRLQICVDRNYVCYSVSMYVHNILSCSVSG
jgi:hypothetical protein